MPLPPSDTYLHGFPFHCRLLIKLCISCTPSTLDRDLVFLANLVHGCRLKRRSGRRPTHERAFSFAGPLAWNKLSPALRDTTDRKQLIPPMTFFELFNAVSFSALLKKENSFLNWVYVMNFTLMNHIVLSGYRLEGMHPRSDTPLHWVCKLVELT